MIIDLIQNKAQQEFFYTAVASINGLNDYRNLSYGGAIRGGKSFVCAGIWLYAAKNFPGSRYHIIRADFPSLSGTTIPTLEKIVAGQDNWRWNRDKSNYFLYHAKSDGKIFFKGESITQDPELDWMLGMETNGIWFEQIEELSEKTWEMGQSRNGSWYIDKMPIPITLSTFNPTQRWIKAKVYEPWCQGKLKAPFYFQKALPNDNPFVTKEQWNAWGNMAERYQKQFIEGDWTDFSDKNNLWAFAFESEKHVSKGTEERPHPVPTKGQELFLSFDFNRNPICCSVIQHYGREVRVLETIKLPNSDIYKMCTYIKSVYPNYLYMVTGDATGQSSSALVKDNINYYTVIKKELSLAASQLRLPKVNPRLEDNQVLFNSVLANYKFTIHKEKGKAFIFDCQNVRMIASGQIDKTDRTDPTMQADALDTVRYWINMFMWDFLKKL